MQRNKRGAAKISLADRVREEALDQLQTDMFEYFSTVLKIDEYFNKPGFLKDSKESICLSSLLLLDIFRGVRKYIFPTSQDFKRELSHLMDRNREFPAHYPAYLAEAAKLSQVDPQAGGEQPFYPQLRLNHRNPLYMNFFCLRSIESKVDTIVYVTPEVLKATMTNEVRFRSFGQNEGGTYNYEMNTKIVRKLMVSEEFFAWLCSRPDIDSLFCSIATIFELLRGYNENPYTLMAYRQISYGMATYRVPIQHLGGPEGNDQDHKNLVCLDFPRFMPRNDYDSNQDLLTKNYFMGRVVQCCYLVSATPSTYNREYFYEIFNNQFIEDKKRYLGHAKSCNHAPCSWQERKTVQYVITRNLPVGSLESSSFSLSDIAGRRHTSVTLPFEFIDMRLKSFDRINFFKYLTKDAHSADFSKFKHNVGDEVLKILEAIPSFEYSFNKDQMSAIKHSLGTLVVGRSGTGKTTCAVMRMVGYRLLEIAKRNRLNGVRKVRYQDFLDPSEFRMVFLTASPLLAKNVKHLYVKVSETLMQGH